MDTVRHIFRILDDFKSVSGLKVNLDKTNGLFFNKTGSVTFNQLPLPLANWNRDVKILGIPYGSDQYLHHFWKNICEDVRISLNRYNNTYSTFDAKSIITKSLILPKVSYAATVLKIPKNIENKINSLIFRFIVPKGNVSSTIVDFAQKRHFGGYNIDHISLHASVFCLIPIFKYAKHICEGIPLTKEQYMIEYNLGFQLSKVLNVPVGGD